MKVGAPRPPRKFYAAARGMWRVAWVWGPVVYLGLVRGPGAAAVALLASMFLATTIDRFMVEPLSASVRRELRP